METSKHIQKLRELYGELYAHHSGSMMINS